MDDTMMSDFMGPLDMDMEFEHDYPQVPTTTALSAPTKPVWVLDFTNNGITNGIAMSQSRMREIETIIHPFGHGGVSSHLGIIGPTAFASPSWVDLAVSLFYLSCSLRRILKYCPAEPGQTCDPRTLYIGIRE